MDILLSSPAKTRPAFARWLGTTNDVTRTFLEAARIPGLINMAGGLPAPETYPAKEVAEIARRAIEEHPGDTLGYGPIEGLPELRDAVPLSLVLPPPVLRAAGRFEDFLAVMVSLHWLSQSEPLITSDDAVR